MTDLDELKAFVKVAPDPSCAHMDWPGAVLDLIERLEKAEAEIAEWKEAGALAAELAHRVLAGDDFREKSKARISELEEALSEGVSLLKGDAVGGEWKQGCASFLRNASRALGGKDND